MTSDEALFSSDTRQTRKKRLSSLSFLFYGLLVFSIIVFFSNRVSPASFWPAGFVAPLAPFIYIANVLLLIYLLFKQPFRAVLVGIVLIIGLPVVHKSYQFISSSEEVARPSLRVLSYNVSFFSVPTVFSKQYSMPDYNMLVTNAIGWLKQNDADILCLQEFFDDEDSDIYNTVDALTKDTGYQHHFVYKDQVKNRTRRGLIILSKFPIVDRGTIFTSENHYNGAVYADVQTPQGTVRMINVHLESMRLGTLKRNIFGALSAYKRGIAMHALQADQLIAFIRESPHPIILCGDLNETPYSYVYHQLAIVMNNAFEEAGQGFGVTYLGKRLSFLRIDQQFATPGLRILRYTTHHDITFSQHLPIEASYSF